jgi:hypothetical protein
VAEFQISKESESCPNLDSAVWLFSEMPSWNHSEVPIQNVVWMVKCVELKYMSMKLLLSST